MIVQIYSKQLLLVCHYVMWPSAITHWWFTRTCNFSNYDTNCTPYLAWAYPGGSIGGLGPRITKGAPKIEERTTWRIGRHSSTCRGAPEGVQKRKLQGRQIDGGWGEGEGAILQLCSRAPKLMSHWDCDLCDPVCDLLDTPLPSTYIKDFLFFYSMIYSACN